MVGRGHSACTAGRRRRQRPAPHARPFHGVGSHQLQWYRISGDEQRYDVAMNAIDLTGRRAVVTGGAQGIGRAIAERFLASGASVSLWDRDQTLVASTARELSTRGDARALAMDVTKADEVDAAE